MSATRAPAMVASAEPFVALEPSGLVRIRDRAGFVRDGIDNLVRDATFADADTKQAAQHIIWESAHELGITSASIHQLYMARGRGEVKGFTVPAMNIRGPTFDVARAALRAAKKRSVGALIFELAKSEMEYTHQTPAEYATSILAAAIKEEWNQPIFIQGDHFQFNAKRYADNPTKETDGIRALVRDAIAAGFYNVDIDASTLVNLAEPTVETQQYINSQLTAELTNLIRSHQPQGVMISVGGEIGEVGKKNSTAQELRAYLNQYRNLLKARGPAMLGVSKVSIQTGTHHGGVVGKDGKVLTVEVDFNTLGALSEVCVKEYGLAGCVQHGASTLPDELFHKFPEVGTAEIHLATGFQNAFFDHPDFPAALKARIYQHLEKAHAEENTGGISKEQFYYKTRKKAFGPFKRDLWDLPPESKAKVMGHLEDRFGFLYEQLQVQNTNTLVAKHVTAVRTKRGAPASPKP
ncbi:MAG TPA: class II fructose-bisphosphate aldolase [Candidatus Thermoplasmatota archaeon]